MPRRRLVSKTDLAELAGVSKMAISKACREGGALHKALVGRDRIHLDHTAVQAYLQRKRDQHQRKVAKPLPALDQPARGDDAEPAEPTDGDVVPEEDLELLRRMADKYGSKRGFRDWLEALKRIEDIRKLRLDNDETEGRLISRDLVKAHVFGVIDAFNHRLLQDMPKSGAQRIHAAVKAGAALEETERIIRDLVGSQLKPLKSSASRTLREA